MRIAIFAISDFFSVQGATEPYYVWRHLSQAHDVVAFVPASNAHLDEKGTYIVRRLKHLPTFVSYNVFILPFLFKRESFRTRLVYTYKGAITPVLVLVFLLRKKWVCDFRTSPLAQEIEFRKLQKTLTPFRRFAYALARWFYRLTLRRCDLVVTLSQEIKEELVQQYRVSPERIFILPLGVDLSKFAPKGKRPNVRETGLRVVYSGAIAPQRGLDVAIQALQRLQGRVPVHLVILGRGPQETFEQLKRRAQELNVADVIEWVGFVPHEQVPEVLDTCHVGLSPLPPLRAYEVSSPAKVVEYLAMGLPVVATDILAHRKVIQHEMNGLLVPPEDPEALAHALERLYRDADLRARLETNARESAKKYGWEGLLRELERRLEQLSL